MAESIGLASGLALANFAFQSSTTLVKRVQTLQHHSKHVYDLRAELEALTAVLGSLTVTVQATTDVDLSALNLPLLRCGNACIEFEQEIVKFLSRSGDSRMSFRDWAKLRYMGDDVDGFRQVVAGYKRTIIIALTDVNLRRSRVTAETLDTYKDLIQTTRIDLEAQLQSIDDKLETVREHSVAESIGPQLVKDEQRIGVEESIQIPTQLSDSTDETRLISKRSRGSHEHKDVATLPRKPTIEGLQAFENSLDLTVEKLERRIKDLTDRLETKFRIATISEEDLMGLARLREEWDVTRKCLEICKNARMHMNEDISNIDEQNTIDATQFMVSPDGETVLGSEFTERHGQGYMLDSEGPANINIAFGDVASSPREKERNTEIDPLALETPPLIKTPRQDGTSHHASADTESLSPTDLESVFSDCSTISSVTSAGILEISATWELIELLLNHDILHPLYELAIRQVTAEKFESHLCGFLRAYGDGLKAEAQNEAQIRASNFVRQSVRRTAREIKLAMLKPMKSQTDQSSGRRYETREQLNLWLESVQKVRATETGDSDSESDKSNGEDTLMDDNEVNSLNEVKNFLTSSRAFVTLCQSLRSWLRMQERNITAEIKHPVNAAGDTIQSIHNEKSPMDIVDNMTMWSSLWFWLMALCYPPPAGFERISYICGCAQPSYVDVRELSPGGILRFQQRLIQSTKVVRTAPHIKVKLNHTTSPPTSSTESKHIPTVGVPFPKPWAPHKESFSISDGHLHSLQADIQTTPEDHHTPGDQHTPGNQPTPGDQHTPGDQVAAQSQYLSEGQDQLPQYLHLCINRKGIPTMSSIDVSCLHNDQYLFQTICQEYRRVRGQSEWRISLLIPAFVRKLFCTSLAPFERFTSFLVGLNLIQQLFHTISQCRLHSVGSGDFVQFQLMPVREECCPGWFKPRSFPPVSEVLKRRYHYAPVPMEDVELLDIPLSHLLKPGPHTDVFWMMTIPKKLGQPLTRQPGAGGQRVIGWGIRINECLNWVVVLCAMLVLLVAIGGSVIAYAVITSDKSSAFGLGAYLVATFTVYISYQYFAWKAE